MIQWTTEGVDQPRCGEPRATGSKTLCELPPDHVVGRNTADPLHWPDHFGRGPAGRWYSWTAATADASEVRS